MPEAPEIRIMSDFINSKCTNTKFFSAYHVEKGNNPKPFPINSDNTPFKISSDYYGKKLILNITDHIQTFPIYVFMGMSGSWKWTDTSTWNLTKFTRLRFDTIDGKSLLLYGGYLGPKYSLYTNFKGSKQGPDILKEFDNFKQNVLNSLNNKVFENPIYEVLLDQRYFSGVGNYLRSTILYYMDKNPFTSARNFIVENPNLFDLCYECISKSYELNGGQLQDWSNPFGSESELFDEWVYYSKGAKLKDKFNRTFWFDPKWLV